MQPVNPLVHTNICWIELEMEHGGEQSKLDFFFFFFFKYFLTKLSMKLSLVKFSVTFQHSPAISIFTPTLDVIAAVGPPLRDLGVLGVERRVQVVCAQGVGGHGRL